MPDSSSSTLISDVTAREIFGIKDNLTWEFDSKKSDLKKLCGQYVGVFTEQGIHSQGNAETLKQTRYFHEHYLIGKDPRNRRERYRARGPGSLVLLVPRDNTRARELRATECVSYPLYTIYFYFNPDEYDLAEFPADHANTKAARDGKTYTVHMHESDFVYAGGRKVR